MKPVALTLACALALVGCQQRDETAGPPQVQVSVSSTSTPVMSSAPAPTPLRTVVRPQPTAAVYADWHADLSAGCGDGSRSVRRQHFDVNGDGLPDTVCWQTVRDATYGDFVQVMAQVDRPNGDKESAYIILAANGGRQAALCNADGVAVRQTLWARGETKAVTERGVDAGFNGPIAITLTDGKCGPVSLFWPRDAGADEARFTLLRI
ncbi:hypothetical protein [Asticcacaulis sp. AC466]|uniref:hypothetical protein n=1 Tax=Asticcacaulis sp. AC466 TaxID=1282362 RepID=UPI0012DE9C14|nr:hypothetical protein [Asticcacaulis sp. AC466]